MKRLFAILILAAACFGQTATVTVAGAHTTKTWAITLVPKTLILTFVCDKSAMEPGDTSMCTVTLSQAARAVVPVTITLPDGFTGPASISFPVGMAAQSFQIARTDVAALGETNDIFPKILVGKGDAGIEYYAVLGLRCGYTSDHNTPPLPGHCTIW